MKRSHLLLAAAWLVHTAAWFLPVIRDGVTLPAGLPGWEAFRAAVSALFGIGGITPWWAAVLSGMSAISTVLFVLGSTLVVFRGSRLVKRASAWVALCAFVVNSHWFVLFGNRHTDLRIGYFLWWSSFLVLAAGLFDLSRHDRESMPESNRAMSAGL